MESSKDKGLKKAERSLYGQLEVSLSFDQQMINRSAIMNDKQKKVPIIKEEYTERSSIMMSINESPPPEMT